MLVRSMATLLNGDDQRVVLNATVLNTDTTATEAREANHALITQKQSRASSPVYCN